MDQRFAIRGDAIKAADEGLRYCRPLAPEVEQRVCSERLAQQHRQDAAETLTTGIRSTTSFASAVQDPRPFPWLPRQGSNSRASSKRPSHAFAGERLHVTGGVTKQREAIAGEEIRATRQQGVNCQRDDSKEWARENRLDGESLLPLEPHHRRT